MESYLYDMILDNCDTYLTSSDSSFDSSYSLSFCLNSTSKFNYVNQNTKTLSRKRKSKKSLALIKSKILISKWFKKSEKKILIRETKIQKHSKDSKISGKISKLMDKSLGWFNKSKKSIKRNKRLSSEYSYCLNSRKSSIHLNHNFMTPNEIMDLNEKFYFHNSSYTLSAPSMCSSFDKTKSKDKKIPKEDQRHSTPRSLFQQFSPIKFENDSFNSQISFSQNQSTPNMTKKRFSFAVTSSPVSHNKNIIDQSNNSDIIDLRLLEHLNDIKKSIKLGTETLKNCQSFDDLSLDLSLIRSNRRKLKKIFQNKLKKQLNEIKKWNLDTRSDFYDKSTVSNRKKIKYNKRHSLYSNKRFTNDSNESNNQPKATCKQNSGFNPCLRATTPIIGIDCFPNYMNIMQNFHLNQNYFYNNFYNQNIHHYQYPARRDCFIPPNVSFQMMFPGQRNNYYSRMTNQAYF